MGDGGETPGENGAEPAPEDGSGAVDDAPQAPPSLAGISVFEEERSREPPKLPKKRPADPVETPEAAPPAPAKPAAKTEEPKSRYQRGARRLKFTREGKYYLGITLGVGFAAINTGNNLLYLLLGMLLSLIVVSGVMSELSLRNLTVTRRLPLRAQVGRPHLVEIEVFNHKGKIPSYAIEVEDLRAGQPADKRCFFLKISPSSAQVAAYRRTPARRGRDHHTGFRIATRFPFGLFEKSREVLAPGDLIIYPAVDPVRLPIDVGTKPGNSGRLIGRGGGDDIYTVRPRRDGDDPRDIYWRKSALASQLVVRERTREARPDVELVLDVIRPAPETEAFATAFEKRIREIASRAVAHLKRGDTVVVRTTASHRVLADRTVGADPVLRFLALVETVDAASTQPKRSGNGGLEPPPPAIRRAEDRAEKARAV